MPRFRFDNLGPDSDDVVIGVRFRSEQARLRAAQSAADELLDEALLKATQDAAYKALDEAWSGRGASGRRAR